ncbi:Poly(A)+ RNA export protein [Punctularia strigosozonata HHB-11173 SS5]|uniref:Poly(A)+ RNA export protein n=1 Tax=Punctularia strigosozonata (strain HHB-11173) TaxID=741275 RepID=R7S4S0_PUNST|nr:Poly(A)+ RNA export protein [Punctularia strigosozonata HHB-11173 SS5]EIN04812.1 Poly(A)+ RNA export protein [Punctularia strigosozonata HHB-11173 SS5]
MSFFGAGSSATTTAQKDPPDIEVADPPTDSISSLAFSGAGEFLAVGSWDNNVRIYEVGTNGQTQGKAMYSHQAPVLSVCWNKDGTKLLSGGADNAGRMFDVQTGQPTQVAQHDAPIKVVKWIESPQGGILATGSWDKTVKYWDLRQSAPIASVTLPERCYTMDVAYPLMVVGCADRHIQIFNLTNPTTAYKTMQSPLKWQTRVVSCFPAANGFAVGSVEGRVAIQYVDDKDASNNFSFKCHRKDATPNTKDQSLVYAVNDITFHPVHGTFSTCGSDGTVHFWDKDARTRLKTFDPCPGPVVASAFNRTGSIFAYAVSYDWSKGYSGMTAGHPNKILLHACKDDEVKKRPTKR